MRPTDLLSSALLFAAASTAFPGWHQLEEAAKRDFAPLIARQQSSTSYDLSFSGSQGNTATTQTSSATSTQTGKSSDNNNDSTNTSGGSTQTSDNSSGNGKSTGKSTGSSGKNTKATAEPTTKTFDARLPAGGVQMITPSAIAGSQYYKIKDYVTFAWNYTSLSITPTAVDILASCSLNSATYTIAMNASVTGPTQAITWDTGEYQATATLPLLTETYTLIIHDAQKDVSATAMAGYLSTWEQFTFGMYVPQPYTPLADYVCATCNGAMSSMERHTLGFLFGMVALTVLSFGWFGGLAGLW